ncbi:glycosyltransferase family 2 protein, partial [Candidatus Fermentibacteria bacterium]|nr:glycosyltransferase family 2 protein [Candidatus Fermentibacteria bacterium]
VKLSLVTIAFNEERDLPRCLDSVGFADEIVVVDSGSTDGTIEAARSRGAKVFDHPFEGFSKQKQFAIDRATGDWILVLDADETAGPGLGEAVRSAIRSGKADAWRIRRKTRYMGRVLRFGPWRGDAPPRLFRRGFARYGEEVVHERLRADGPVRLVRDSWIEHEPYDSIPDHIARMARYAELWASQEAAAGRTCSPADLLIRPQWRLFRALFLQMGFLDGIPGIAASVSSAMYAWWKYLALREASRRSL